MADATAELKARARQVGEERDSVEAEIAAISARLQAPGQPGLKGSLLDGQGFPRADINIPRIAADRNRLTVLHNDHKRLSSALEAAILAVHEAARLSAKPRTDSSEPTQPAAAQAAAPAATASRADATAAHAAAPSTPDAADAGTQAAAPAEPGPSEQASGGGGAPMETDEATSCQGLPPFALIDAVAAGSPAEQDGLRVGDYLVAFGGVRGQAGDAAVAAVARELQESEGRSVPVAVLRAGRAHTLQVVPRTWSGRGLLGSHMVPL